MAALFLAPWAIGFLVFTLGPLIASGYLSLTDYGLLSAPEFVGLSNYAKMLADDPRFMKSIGVTALYVFVSVPVTLVVAFLVAMLVNDRQRSSKAGGKPRRSPLFGFYRAAFYLPSLIAASVAVAILWVRLFAYDGIVNDLLAPLGLSPVAWIGQPGTAIWTIILLSVWSFGSTMVIFLAALKQVPAERYEAAGIDGAGMLRRLWHITLPAISPIILFNAVTVLVNALHSFTPAYIVSNGTGGPADSTLVFALYLYEQAFRDLNMGYASAMAVLMLLALAGITALIFASSRVWVHYED
ncbi:sugar ABC transporter permease [Acrocarpospora macrocephala]|uniref:ABC transporter permease n=1 Tax=Acrocarpospora macrocephala TaxID=150177 RepID=A0A5M3WYF7_9ACTN|nr:sugar ABC transporter permease [Acrocarpospora macrocephala]GES11098.1 ABC transporter permease [Acrocarpospora macrocephala]